MADPDLELLVAWRAGDRQAGGTLLDRHFAAVRRFFRTKVGDDHEDLVQRTFTRCVEVQVRFRAEGSFRSYLFAIAHNVLREHLRVRRRDARVEPDSESVADLGLPGPSTFAAARREQQLLLQALRRLPINDQIVLELFYWESMTSAEISAVLDLPDATIRTRLRSARQRLRGFIDELARDVRERQSTIDGFDHWVGELREHLG